jgi:hypothetical protein
MAANCQANYYLDFARVGDRSSEWSSLFHRAIEVRKNMTDLKTIKLVETARQIQIEPRKTASPS